MHLLENPETAFAVQTVRRASLLVQRIQRATVTPALNKKDRSPVTLADFASQALVGALFRAQMPGAVLVGEEDSAALKKPDAAGMLEAITRWIAGELPGADAAQVCTWIDHGAQQPSRRFWTLDPIDGTKGFLRGDQYAIALALIEDGQVQIGVLGCPNLRQAATADFDGPGSLVLAVRGRGCWVTGLHGDEAWTQLGVSTVSETAAARLLRSYESGHTDPTRMEEIAEHLGVRAEAVRLDSQAKYALLAAGHGDLLFRLLSPDMPDYREKIWDQAAGSIVVEEAGGRISDLDGQPLNFTTGRELTGNRGVVASNNLLHPAALRALRDLGV